MLESQIERVELYFSCRKLKRRDALTKVDPQIKVFCQKQNERPLLGQTEVIKDSSNPNFKTTVVADFVFETQQRLIFEAYDYSLYHSYHSFEKIGHTETTLGKIMGSPKQLLILDIKNDEGKVVGKLIVQGEKTGHSKNNISWQWSGVKLMNTDGLFDKSDPFLRFFKIRGPGDYLQVHETEVIMDNLNPVWKPFSIMDYKLCEANYDKPFRIECWDWEADKRFQYIGDCEVTLNQLKAGKNMLELRHPKKKKSTGSLKLSNFRLQEEYSFIDYIRGGQQLKVFVGIDFTGSNKIVSDPTSLHTVNPNGYNQYQQAIYAVSQILLNYDYDQAIRVYGFGGIPHWPMLYNGNVSHCFPCTGNPQQPAVYGIEGIMNAYFNALQNVELSGPTYFSPLVHEVMQFCKFQKTQPNEIYSVLLILTDGDIHDMEQTINCLIESSHLPLSIVIVGVGNENFKNMEKLDGDHGLCNSKGQYAQRDLVQFVPFKNFQGDVTKLAQKVLAEIPDQLVKYMHLTGKKPNPPILTNIHQLETSGSFTSQQSFGSPGHSSSPGGHPGQYQRGQSGNFPGAENQPPSVVMPMNTSNNQQNMQYGPGNQQGGAGGLKQSELIQRYSLEPIVNPLQDKINLHTFDMPENDGKVQQQQQQQQFPVQGYPGYPGYPVNAGFNPNSDPNMSLHCQIYPTFESTRHPNQG